VGEVFSAAAPESVGHSGRRARFGRSPLDLPPMRWNRQKQQELCGDQGAWLSRSWPVHQLLAIWPMRSPPMCVQIDARPGGATLGFFRLLGSAQLSPLDYDVFAALPDRVVVR